MYPQRPMECGEGGRLTRFRGKVLEALREEQMDLAGKVRVGDDLGGELATVAGVDVAYDEGRGKAFSACVVLDFVTGEVVEERTATCKIPMPYIPTYLTFREMPPMKAVLQRLRGAPTVVMVDGNGILHPLGIGLASHLGVSLGTPTIGVAKSLLVGEVAGDPVPGGPGVPVTLEGRTVGHALVPTPRCRRPIYISPGHRVSHMTAVEVVRRFCTYRLPEPVRLADKLSKKTRGRG